MKQIEATILGQSYMLACPPDGEQLLQHAVAIVDREMGAIRDAGKVKARERIAVLTALNLAYQRAEQARAGTAASASAPRSEAADASATASATASTAANATIGVDQAELERLIQRIDRALAEDGLLL